MDYPYCFCRHCFAGAYYDSQRTHAFGIVSTYDFLSILRERVSVDVEDIIDEHIDESIIGVGLG